MAVAIGLANVGEMGAVVLVLALDEPAAAVVEPGGEVVAVGGAVVPVEVGADEVVGPTEVEGEGGVEGSADEDTDSAGRTVVGRVVGVGAAGVLTMPTT